MPEMYFRVRWPDGAVEDCYSPSTVIVDHFVPGTSYPLADFVEHSRKALQEGSERVRAKYGFACAGALTQLESIEASAARHANDADAKVTVEALLNADGSTP